MKITVDSTPTIVALDETHRARRWEGTTESGIPVVALIAFVSPQTHDPAVIAQFESELVERTPPETPFADRAQALMDGMLAPLLAELKSEPHRRENVQVALN